MFQKVHYHISSKKIKSPVTIAMLADLHNKEYGENNQILLDEVKKHAPDFVCLAGDMLIGHTQIPYEAGQKAVMELAKEYEVFYGLGNHEARMRQKVKVYGTRYEDYMKPIKELGVHVLVNENAEIHIGENRFCVHGYDLPPKYFEKFNRYVFDEKQIEEVLDKCEDKEEVYHILLAHNPMYFKQYAAWGADLTLSGHLHGGIIRLPIIGGVITPQAKLFPRYSAGKYSIGEKEMIVSRGLGTHTIPIRFNNKPELSVIHLSPAR